MTEKMIPPIRVKVLQVWAEKNKVKLSSEFEPDGKWFDVVTPCSVKYISKGDAMASVSFEGDKGFVSFCKMLPNGETNHQENYQKKDYKPRDVFKPANNVPEDVHYRNEVKVLERLTLKEFELTYNLISQSNDRFITATQSFMRLGDTKEIETKDGKELHYLYDFIVYMKVKPKVEKEPSEELPDY